MPKISIIVPVYKTEKYLETCLDSLINQTLDELEIILVNDGSPDGSQEIIDRYQTNFPEKIRACMQPNQGQAAARNNGLQYATGEYIFFVDSDDYLEPDACEKAYGYAVRHALDIVCFGMYKNCGDTQEEIAGCLVDVERPDLRYLLNEASPCNKIIKAGLFLDNGLRFTEQRIYEDLELIPQLVLYTDKIGFIKDCLYHYVIHDDSVMRQRQYSPKLADIYLVMNTLKERFFYTKYRTELEFVFIEHLLHAAVLRFLGYRQGRGDIEKISDIMKATFPSWRKNPYFQMQNWKYKLVCLLASWKAVGVLRQIVGEK